MTCIDYGVSSNKHLDRRTIWRDDQGKCTLRARPLCPPPPPPGSLPAIFLVREESAAHGVRSHTPPSPHATTSTFVPMAHPVMDVFAVQAYFGLHVLAFVETLLKIEPHPLSPANPLEEEDQDRDQKQCRFHPHEQEQRRGGLDAGSRPTGPFGAVPEAATAGFAPAPGPPFEAARPGIGSRGVPGSTGRTRLASDGKHGGRHRYAPAEHARGQYTHLRVSSSFRDRAYGDLARYLIERGAMPLGLYRPAGTKGSLLPYTHINPPPSEMLNAWPPASGSGKDGAGAVRAVADGSGAGEHDGAWGGVSGRGQSGNTRAPPMEGPSPAFVERGDEVFVLLARECSLRGEA